MPSNAGKSSTALPSDSARLPEPRRIGHELQEEQEEARRKQDEAWQQLNLLLQAGVAHEKGDFYPYR